MISELTPSAPSPLDRGSSGQAEVFYEPLLATYLDGSGTVPRDWLRDAVMERMERPGCRFVLLLGEPGAGKTGLMAALARSMPGVLRYFVRLDSTTPLSGGDAVSMLLRVGHQLAHLRPEIFDPELLQIEVTQRADYAGPGASVTGVKIDDLKVSPFYRTAIRVQQHVTTLEGGLAGVEISRATIEPRLLETDTLSQLALFDPARVLARKAPGEKIVVLVDALDEVIATRGASTVLDWLETMEEPPANLQFVLTSRPHARLRMLESVRGAALEVISIDAESEQVERDVRLFASRLFDETRVLEQAAHVLRESAVTSLAQAAQGNFAYLTAYGRSVRAALATHSAEQVAELLQFESLPAGLPQLYAAFARRMRRQIEALGQLDVASPRGANDELVPAWEGVGQRLLGVLSVAFAPLTLKQIASLGGVRVWESAAGNVLQTLAPFLDETRSGWKLFHPSLGEFLKSADQQGAPDVAIDAHEWHTRILRHYQGGVDWADVNWRGVDSYGLLYAAAHLAAASDDPLAVCEVVTPSLRVASKERFHSELPFRRVVETAKASVDSASRVEAVLSEGVFLQLVLSGLSQGAEQLEPVVYGLMARLGRVEEALARTQVMEPSLRKYRTLEAIWHSTPAESRKALGRLDGVELLVGAAIEVPETATPIVGALGYDRALCLHDAALAMLSHDLDRALSLAAMADKLDQIRKATDAVLGAAARVATPAGALELLSRMHTDRVGPAVKAAEKAAPGAEQDALIAMALAHLEDEEPEQRLPPLARLLVLQILVLQNGAAESRDGVAGTPLRQMLDTLLDSSSGRFWGVVHAAEILHGLDSGLAEQILERCDQAKLDSLLADTLVSAARLWASWGKPAEARLRLDRALEVYRGINWYGPARDIARAANIAADIDPEWGAQLAQEAMGLVEPELNADPYEWGRLNGILSGMFSEFRSTNQERALKVARWMKGGWIHGANWDGADGRGGALALIGLDAADHNPALAAQLLAECLEEEDSDVHLGRGNARLVRTGLFRPKDETSTESPSDMRAANAKTYILNEVNYWIGGRKWRFFQSPAAVVRSMDDPYPATASWARAVGAAVDSIAATDLDSAIVMAHWPADPGERLIGLATLTGAMEEVDPRLQTIQTEIVKTLAALPEYEPEVDLAPIAQGPVLQYLDPSVRARFEAALLMNPKSNPFRLLPKDREESWYLQKVFQAETLFNALLAGSYRGVDLEDFEAQMDAVAEDYSHTDPLLEDLLQLAASYSVATHDIGRADRRIERIANPAIKATARLLRLHFAERNGTSRTAEALKILHALSDDINPAQRAELAVNAAAVCWSTGENGSEILDWGLAQAEGADPLMMTRALTTLSSIAPEDRRAPLLAQALHVSEQIRNQYLRNDAVDDLLGNAVATGHAALMARVLGHMLDAGWFTFMEGLRRAMPQIVAGGGIAIIEKMDDAMRRAQDVILMPKSSIPPKEHFDGVLSPPLRKKALESAWNEATQFLQAYLATYLEQADFGAAHRWVQDSRLHQPDDDDDAFERFHGRLTGLSVWLAEPDNPVWRTVDIRFVFDTVADASAYHRERLLANGEGNPEVSGAPLVGEECHVFGGTARIKLGRATRTMTSFTYVFQVGRVVVKLFVAEGQQTTERLVPGHLVPFVERIQERIRISGFNQASEARRRDGAEVGRGRNVRA